MENQNSSVLQTTACIGDKADSNLITDITCKNTGGRTDLIEPPEAIAENASERYTHGRVLTELGF